MTIVDSTQTYQDAIRRIQELEKLNSALAAEVDAQRKREQGLSEAYLRLRRLIGRAAFDTPHGPAPEQVWTTTEIALAALAAEADRMRPVVAAAVEWRRYGYERKHEFMVGIRPMLDVIDIYDVGAPRPCEEL